VRKAGGSNPLAPIFVSKGSHSVAERLYKNSEHVASEARRGAVRSERVKSGESEGRCERSGYNMLSYLSGTIQKKEISGGTQDKLVLDVGGVGLEIYVTHTTLLTLGQLGEAVTIHTSLSIKETEWNIFGFATAQEKELFALLQSVSGIGPKLALTLVGSFAPAQLAQAIMDEDSDLITQAPGVGPKVAQRIVLELKSKIKDWHKKSQLASTTDGEGKSGTSEEVRAILTNLGYTVSEISMAFAEAKKAGVPQDVESIVRFSLKVLGAAVNS
jgi:holliday junction DNA helicase RuvA